MHKGISALTFVLFLGLNACTEISFAVDTALPISPTLSPAKESFTPTPTSPPAPPLSRHEWDPQPVLISFGAFAGDGVSSMPAEFTLLGNGVLYIYEGSLYTTRLSSGEVCRLLNTIEQTGFLQYDPSVINHDLMGDGGGGNYINVDAWKSQHFYLGQLSEIIDGHANEGLRKAYQLLKSYRPDGLERAELSAMLSFREDENATDNDILQWPAELFPIANYYDASGCQFIATRPLNASEANEVFALTQGALNTYVSDGSRLFNISVEWLLPEQRISACSNHPGLPSEFLVADLPEALVCTAEDGVLTIP